MSVTAADLCRQLAIDDPSCVEIESKWKLSETSAKTLRRRLEGRADVEPLKSSVFFDQYLDTPNLDLLRLGASLRLRYRKSGEKVYLQYKGPGFCREGLHFRSEFRSRRLDALVSDESQSELLRFAEPPLAELLEKAPPEMSAAMRRQLGAGVVSAVTEAVLLCQYSKDAFAVQLDGARLSPSVDHLCVFRLGRGSFLPLSTFWEYENQVDGDDLDVKLAALPSLLAFDAALESEFELRREPLDKYRRGASRLLLARERIEAPPAPALAAV